MSLPQAGGRNSTTSKEVVVRRGKLDRSTSGLGLGCAKTKSDLVVMPSGEQISAFFCSERDHTPQNFGCNHTAQRFHTAWVKNPTRLGDVACCARAASGHAAAPPSSVMISRRLITQ
jgi:hypothetical protein